MEENKEKEIPGTPILEQIKEYAETRFKLSKYKIIEKSTSLVASLVTAVIVAVSGLLAFILFILTLALLIGEALGAAWKGFGVMTLVCVLLAVIVIAAKKSFEKPIINSLISKILK
jgi:hypothetical protein